MSKKVEYLELEREERTVGRHIRQARKDKGWTQEYMASLLFISKQTVSHWERNQSEPDFEMLKKLVKLLNIDVLRLFATIICFIMFDDLIL